MRIGVPIGARSRSLTALSIIIGALVQVWAAGPARADPDAEPILFKADVTEDRRCATLRIAFNLPINLIGKVAPGAGSQVRIRIRPVAATLNQTLPDQDTLPAPASAIASVSAIAFEGDGPEGPTLNLTFRRQMFYSVSIGRDFRSVVVALSSRPDRSCNADGRPTIELGKTQTPDANALPAPAPAPPTAPTADARTAFDTARTALSAKDYSLAITTLTSLVALPASTLTPDALELLGLARERSGQMAHAKLVYQDLIKRYPASPAADRARQRLDTLLALGEVPNASLGKLGLRGLQKPDTWVEAHGSLGEFYYRNSGFSRLDDTVRQVSTTQNLVYQNQLLTSLDGTATLHTPGLIGHARISTTYTDDFLSTGRDHATLSALYIDASDPRKTLFARLGRQTLSDDGVLGRFDGLFASARVMPDLKLQFVSGFPVDSSRVMRVDTTRPFAGVSLGLGPFVGAWSGDLFFIEQQNHDLIDRQAVGGEIRYLDHTKTLFAGLDYDIHFQRTNFATLNSAFTLPDSTTVNVSLDYRRSPFLTTRNALIEQLTSSISQLQQMYGADQVYEFALDRTAVSRTATVSITHPLSQRFSIEGDATVDDMGATRASAGVAAQPATGTEEYLSTQLIGTSLFKEGDLAAFAARYANSASSSGYALDFNARFPIFYSLRINPRIILSYKDFKTQTGSEISAKPSLRLDYYFKQHFQVELEGGAEWTKDRSPANNTLFVGEYFDAGLRASF